MFSSPEVLSAQHAAWRIRPIDYAFARSLQSAPVVLGELPVLCRHFPLLFVDSPEGVVAVALMGLREGENLFVHNDGSWAVEATPLHLRRYPFVLIELDDERMTLGLDANASCWVKDVDAEVPEARPIFEADGKTPNAETTQAFGVLIQFKQDSDQTREFCKALKEAGLLVPQEAITRSGDKEVVVKGFSVVDEARLAEIPSATLEDWCKKGWLKALYAHLLSLDALRDLGHRLDVATNAA